MKRAVLIPLIILALVSLACQLGGRKAEEAQPTVAAPAEGSTEATAAPAEQEAAGVSFEDSFDEFGNQWRDPVLVTTQGTGGKTKSEVKVEDGMMAFKFTDKETYLYEFISDPIASDVAIEVGYQAGGQLQNGIAIVCRANEDFSAWYEFRLSSTGKVAIYRFDKSLKEDYKNPYIELKAGAADAQKLFPTKKNIIRAVCDGSKLSLEANGNSLMTVQDRELKDNKLVGIGAMSQDILPVTIRFDYIKVNKP